LEALLAFDKDNNIAFKEKRYQYADKLTQYRKSDLEASLSQIWVYFWENP